MSTKYNVKYRFNGGTESTSGPYDSREGAVSWWADQEVICRAEGWEFQFEIVEVTEKAVFSGFWDGKPVNEITVHFRYVGERGASLSSLDDKIDISRTFQTEKELLGWLEDQKQACKRNLWPFKYKIEKLEGSWSPR